MIEYVDMNKLGLFIVLMFSLFLVLGCSVEPSKPDLLPQPEVKAVTLISNSVVTEYDTIQEAVEAASSTSSSVIRLNKDMVLDSQVTIQDKSIVLIDANKNISITRAFSSDTANRMFVVSGNGSLSISSNNGTGVITIDGAKASGDESLSDRQVFACGLGEDDKNSVLILGSGVVIQNNVTSSKGSAVLSNGKLTMNGATIKNCTTTDNGGAIQLSYETVFKMKSGLIENNSAKYGGAINMAYTASADISGGTIRNNSASTGGGNIYLGGKSTMTIGNVVVTGGKYGSTDNDIGMGNGTSTEKTTLNISGSFDCGSLEIRGKNSLINISSEIGNHKTQISSTVSLSAVERIAMFSGTSADTQYGCFRWPDGRMYDDDANVRVRFFDGYFKATEESMWGDSTYIEFPDGKNMLIDVGYEETGNQIAKVLWAYGINKIDYFICSHFHSDHVFGFKSLINKGKIKVDNFISTTYMPLSGYGWLTQIFNANNINHIYWSAGSSATIGGVDFNVVWPLQERLTERPQATSVDTDPYTFVKGNSTDMNDSSLVFSFKYGDNTILFTGDIYTDAEAELLSLYPSSTFKCDILKAMHHGKNTSASDAFLQACDPDFAVAMITRTTSHSTIASGYEDNGIPLFTTRYSGDVVVTLKNSGYTYTKTKSSLTSE